MQAEEEESGRPTFPTSDVIGRGGLSRILTISNLPAYYLWFDVLDMLRTVLPWIGHPRVRRALRTIEEGRQAFWILFGSIQDALMFRGLMVDRRYGQSPRLRIDFVHGNLYSERASRFHDAWSPRYGMELENRPQACRSADDRLGFADIADRPPTMPPVVNPLPGPNFLNSPPSIRRAKTRRRQRKRRGRSGLDPANGGSL